MSGSGNNHEYVRLVTEPGGPIGVPRLLILAGSSLALADFRPDNLIDLSAAQAAPLSLASAKPGRGARKMRATGGGGEAVPASGASALPIAPSAERNADTAIASRLIRARLRA